MEGEGYMPDLRWTLSRVCPPDWSSYLAETGAGFYHSPLGLLMSVPRGEPVYCSLFDGDSLVGVALGVGRRCRFSTKLRHFDFPALPAVVEARYHSAGLVSLLRELRDLGAAESSIYSLDTTDMECGVVPELNGQWRQEYVIPLEEEPEGQAARYRTTYRRYLRRGEREGWTIESLRGEGALETLRRVRGDTATRIMESGRSFNEFPHLDLLQSELTESRDGWGVETYAGYRGQTLLAAAMIGWAGRRGYYIIGGSSREGYRRGAAAWLHWRIMCQLIERRHQFYNMGGSPGEFATAGSPDDPYHGLYRFKIGLGAKPIPCRGGRWIMRPGHQRLHQLVDLIRN